MTGTKDERIAHVERRLQAINKHAQMLHDKLMRAERRADARERALRKLEHAARMGHAVTYLMEALSEARAVLAQQEPAQDAGNVERTSDRPWLSRNTCHADGDGHCTWEYCPQLRDNEPAKSGRHCPLDTFNRGAADQPADAGEPDEPELTINKQPRSCCAQTREAERERCAEIARKVASQYGQYAHQSEIAGGTQGPTWADMQWAAYAICRAIRRTDGDNS